MNSFSSTRVNDLKSADAWPSGGALVVTATFNERDNIDLLIEKVLATDPTIQLLVIDDDSPDQTGIHAMLLATQNARLHVLVRRGRRGLGSAIEEGFREASRRGFFVAVTPPRSTNTRRNSCGVYPFRGIISKTLLLFG